MKRPGKFPHDDGFCNWEYSARDFCDREVDEGDFYCPSHLRAAEMVNGLFGGGK